VTPAFEAPWLYLDHMTCADIRCYAAWNLPYSLSRCAAANFTFGLVADNLFVSGHAGAIHFLG
jgi:hypothetical protein